MNEVLRPLSTIGIGSIPFVKDSFSCEKIFQEWDLPFWPQYPSRSLRENFIYQFLSPFPGVQISDPAVAFNEAEYLKNEPVHREKLRRAFSEKKFLGFEPPSDWALGYFQMKSHLEKGADPEKRIIKLQITGPETVWKSFLSKQVSPLNEDRVRKTLLQTLTAVGCAQIERVQAHQRALLIFIDEPIVPQNLSQLKEMVQSFKNFGARVGLHVCSASSWKGFEELGIQIFHFDLNSFPEIPAPHRTFIRDFLKNKNWIAWGIVPTAKDSDFKARDLSSFLLSRLEEFSGPGLTADAILNHSLLAPACGTGTLRPDQHEAVFRSLKMTAKAISERSLCF